MFRKKQVVSETCTRESNVQEIRKTVMYATDGLCDVALLIDPDSGELLSTVHVCEKTRTFSKRVKWGEDEDDFVVRMTLGEKKFKGELELPCLLSDTQVQMLEDKATLPCQQFRSWIVSSPYFNVKAVHIFNWDGTPRPTVTAIKWALCRYPSQKKKMHKVLKIILAAALVAGAVYLAKSARTRMSNRQQKSQEAPSSSSSPSPTPSRYPPSLALSRAQVSPRSAPSSESSPSLNSISLGPTSALSSVSWRSSTSPSTSSLNPTPAPRSAGLATADEDEVASPLYSSIVMNRRDIVGKKYLPPYQLNHFNCKLRALKEGPFASASIGRALALYEDNAGAFSTQFVGDNDPEVVLPVFVDTNSPTRGGLNYVSFKQFQHELACCAQIFVEQVLPSDIPVEMWILYDREGFQSSHVWASFLILPWLAPYLNEVRFLDVARTDFSEFARPRHVVVVNDALFSSTQFRDVFHVSKWLDRLRQVLFRDLQVHILAPYVGPKFLVHHGIPLTTLGWWNGRKLMLEAARKHIGFLGVLDVDVLQRIRDILDDHLGPTWVNDAESVFTMLRQTFPSYEGKEIRDMAKYLVTKDIGGKFMDVWSYEHLRFYATTVMDSVENGKESADTTTFFFDHRMPSSQESKASEVFPRPIVPPFKKWAWKMEKIRSQRA